MDRILISGLRELGVHGVLPEEQERPQPFEVDLELLVDLAPAGASDELADTVDYGAVCEAVRRVVADGALPAARAARDAHRRGVPRRSARAAASSWRCASCNRRCAAQLDYVGVRIER